MSQFPSASIDFFLLESLPKTLGWHSGPNGFLWNTAKVVACVVFLLSRLSSFMLLSSIFHDSFFSQKSDHTLMLKFNMQIWDQNISLYFSVKKTAVGEFHNKCLSFANEYVFARSGCFIPKILSSNPERTC